MCFEVDGVRLVELQLGAVFDDDDAFVLRNLGGEGVEERGLAAAGAAGDDGVLVQQDREGEELLRLFAHASRFDERAEVEGGLLEFADGDAAAVAG